MPDGFIGFQATKSVVFETFNAIHIDIRSESGSALHIKSDSYMNVSIKVGSTDLGSATYFWEYQNGKWISVSQINSNQISSGYYIARTSTVGWKNLDKIVSTSYSSGRVVKGSVGLANAQVIIWGENYSGYHVTYCDLNGNYNIGYKSDASATFRVTIIDKVGVANHYKVFTSTSFNQAKNFDFDQVALGEVQQKANVQSMNEFKIREYQDANV